MHVIHARNVNDALGQGLLHLRSCGQQETSRNGAVLVAPTPVTTIYERPMERVLFCPNRDANPFFHLMEALWMMAGCNDLAWPLVFNSRFVEYSDDGETLRGAYGFRWRQFFGFDQIPVIIKELRKSPTTRRCVLGMWAPAEDLGANSKDIPCNTTIYFSPRGGVLDMTVCCRSNDIYWGAYGANAVHMSVLQELVATASGFEVGRYYQMSNNYHLYTEVVALDSILERAASAVFHDAYAAKFVAPAPLIGTSFEEWDRDLYHFVVNNSIHAPYHNTFFARTAVPMIRSWVERKNKQSNGWAAANDIEAPDWRVACCNWIERRNK